MPVTKLERLDVRCSHHGRCLPSSDQARQHQPPGDHSSSEDCDGVRRASDAGHSDASGERSSLGSSQVDEAVRDRWEQSDFGGSFYDGACRHNGVRPERGVHSGHRVDQGLGQDARHRYAHDGLSSQPGESLYGEDEGFARRAERGGSPLPFLPVLLQSAGGEVDAYGSRGVREPRAAGALSRHLHLRSNGGRALQVHRAVDALGNQPNHWRNH